MKKLKLKALDLGATELLSREQLKNVLGGDGSYNGACDGKPSTIWCRDSSSTELGHIDQTGCPASGADLDKACSKYATYTRSTSTCTC